MIIIKNSNKKLEVEIVRYTQCIGSTTSAAVSAAPQQQHEAAVSSIRSKRAFSVLRLPCAITRAVIGPGVGRVGSSPYKLEYVTELPIGRLHILRNFFYDIFYGDRSPERRGG